MITNIREIISNALPVIRVSVVGWLKSKKFLVLEKRLLIIAGVFFLALFISQKAFGVNEVNKFIGEKGNNLKQAEEKIKGEDAWKPVGVGDSRNITGLPYIYAGAVIDANSGKVIWSKNIFQKNISCFTFKACNIYGSFGSCPVRQIN